MMARRRKGTPAANARKAVVASSQPEPTKPTDVRAELRRANELLFEHYRLLTSQAAVAKRLVDKIADLLDRGDLTAAEVHYALEGSGLCGVYAPWWRITFEDFVTRGRFGPTRDGAWRHLMLATGLAVVGAESGDLLDTPEIEEHNTFVKIARRFGSGRRYDRDE